MATILKFSKSAAVHKVNSYYTLAISYCTFCVEKHTILGPTLMYGVRCRIATSKGATPSEPPARQREWFLKVVFHCVVRWNVILICLVPSFSIRNTLEMLVVNSSSMSSMGNILYYAFCATSYFRVVFHGNWPNLNLVWTNWPVENWVEHFTLVLLLVVFIWLLKKTVSSWQVIWPKTSVFQVVDHHHIRLLTSLVKTQERT